MKKITWIASYPKSGNTYMRLFLASYFYTTNGVIKDFEVINNIFKISRYAFLQNYNNVPSMDEFIKDPLLVSEYWNKIQKALSKKIQNNLFIKTHDSMVPIKDRTFTSEQFTKCFIYIVRDPRSVAVSYSHHMNISIEKTINFLINKNYIISYRKNEMTLPEIVSSWSNHYNSWKNFLNKGNGLIIRYEDSLSNPFYEFKKILIFLNKFFSFHIDDNKINNSLQSTQFSNLQNMESKIGFKENPNSDKNFFRKGEQNEWKQVISIKEKEIIEKSFKLEMEELNYL